MRSLPALAIPPREGCASLCDPHAALRQLAALDGLRPRQCPARRGTNACRRPPRRGGVQLELGSRQRRTAHHAPLSSSVAEDRPHSGLARSAMPHS